MDMKKILEALSAAQAAAQVLEPALQALGIPRLSGAVKIAEGALGAAEAIRDAIREHQEIAGAAEDQAALEAIITRLQGEADALSAKIDAS